MSERSLARATLKRVKQKAKDILEAHGRRDLSVCALLRLLPQFAGTSDQEILDTQIKLTTVHFALAREAGYSSWPKYRQHLEAAEASAASALQSEAPTGPLLPLEQAADSAGPVTLPLLVGGRPDNWWLIDGADRLETRGCELLVHRSLTGSSALHALVGGMSLDHYRVSVDLRLDCKSIPAGFELTLRAAVSDDSSALIGNRSRHVFTDREVNRRTVQLVGVPLSPGEWHTFEALFDDDGSGYSFDSREIRYSRHHDWQVLPRTPHGFLELIVDNDGNVPIRLRNLAITLLKPTRKQLAELAVNAQRNLEPHVRLHRPAS